MEAEPGGGGIGLLRAVDDRTERVEDTSGDDQPHHDRAAARPQLGQIPDRDPSERDVDEGGQPARSGGPKEVEEDTDDCSAPDDRQEDRCVRSVQERDRDRRVGARNEQENVGVVQALPHDLPTRCPVEAVIGRRDAEEDEGAGQVDGGSDLRGGRGRQAHEDDGCGQGQRGGGQVQPPAQLRLDLHELAREPLFGRERCDLHPFPLSIFQHFLRVRRLLRRNLLR